MKARDLHALWADDRQPGRADAPARRLARTRLSVRQQCRLFGRTASLLSAGVPIVEAFDLQLQDNRNAAEKRVMQHLVQAIGAGQPLSDSMDQCRSAFTAHQAQVVQAGEVSGQLPIVLSRMSQQLEKQYRLQQQVRRTMRYPLGVLAFAIAVSIGMLWFVVPVFAQLFAQQQAALPGPTRTLLTLATGIREYGWALASGLLVAVAIVRYGLHMPAVRAAAFTVASGFLPGLGPVVQRAALARLTRLLGLMMQAGIPLSESLNQAVTACSDRRLANGLSDARSRLLAGQSLHEALSAQRGWPSFVLQLIRTGEASGQLDTMLERASELLEQSAEHRAGRMLALLEPGIMAILAILVGGLLLALYLPVFSMGAAF